MSSSSPVDHRHTDGAAPRVPNVMDEVVDQTGTSRVGLGGLRLPARRNPVAHKEPDPNQHQADDHAAHQISAGGALGRIAQHLLSAPDERAER